MSAFCVERLPDVSGLGDESAQPGILHERASKASALNRLLVWFNARHNLISLLRDVCAAVAEVAFSQDQDDEFDE